MPYIRIFVTSTKYIGGFVGGVAGADAECQARANAAVPPLGGTWKAWISDSTTSPSTRFVHQTIPYVTLSGNGIADDWNDLTDGSLDSRIWIDENKVAIPTGQAVWTGTFASGQPVVLPFQDNCTDWTSTAMSGAWGDPYSTSGGTWSFQNYLSCSQNHRLYCFEQ